ncbi:MAG: FAD:protein FMN transferase [Fusobacteria bacterium]|nr:FAD:protein FMN transferase [Fusobacteriota bacterium]
MGQLHTKMNKKHLSKSISLLLIFYISTAILMLTGCSRDTHVTQTRYLFGTDMTIDAYTTNLEQTKENINQAFKIMSDIDTNINTYSSSGDMRKLNTHLNEWVKVSPQTIWLINEATEGSKMTNGSYDITVYPLLKLWGFNRLSNTQNFTLPSKKALKEATDHINYKEIKMRGNEVKLATPLEGIDVGSILKGYAIEEARNYLASVNEKSAMVTAVSSIAVTGSKPDGSSWEIGVQNPTDLSKYIGVISLPANMALGISGNYENYIVIDGKKYSHILDAKTGMPVQDMDMVVVICHSSATADLYSTALFLMTPQKAIDTINDTAGMSGFVVDMHGKIYYSNQIKRYFKETR